MKNILFISLAIGLYACGSGPEPVEPPPPPVPVATAATFITDDSFTANWNDATGASNYELEIATDQDFTNIIASDKNAVTAIIIFGLVSHTQYFYRVRAGFDSQQDSDYSNVISLYTLPVAPVATAATNVLSDGFTANWHEVLGISNYLLFFSRNTHISYSYGNT